MNLEQYLILIDGEDKTHAVESVTPFSRFYAVKFSGTPRIYSYSEKRVCVEANPERIDPRGQIILMDGKRILGVSAVLNFNSHYRVKFESGAYSLFKKEEITFLRDCLADKNLKDIFEYFRETAREISLITEEGQNILQRQYDLVQSVSEETVLRNFLDPTHPIAKRAPPDTIIYPFGANQSQINAIENALTSQISIIEGPPGTGKTQTILNIITNIVRNDKTVAVVSNNNAATHNIVEKLEKKGLSFFTAFLGNFDNKTAFLEGQSETYPDMTGWEVSANKLQELELAVKIGSSELYEMMNARNRIAAIEHELLELTPEQHYFSEYYSGYSQNIDPDEHALDLPSRKILALWVEYEQCMERNGHLGWIKKIWFLIRYGLTALRIVSRQPITVVPYLQNRVYEKKKQELLSEKAWLETKLEHYSFAEKTAELCDNSLKLFRAGLAKRFPPNEKRHHFDAYDLRYQSREFSKEYPVVLSTAYSIKSSLRDDHIYDYLIVDETSQVDLATGALALSCARNVVIVGDLQQLPNVIDKKNIAISEFIWEQHHLPDAYRYSIHSLLSSARALWPKAPTVLLREHYRCHPKIINFCNQKFYAGQLIVMTSDHNEANVLAMYLTAPGNHARGRVNQRQIDVIKREVIPGLRARGYRDIGVITPYRNQVKAIQSQLGNDIEVATVHKFQGREKDAIILTSVDNVITDFVDDARMLNVAVSRAAKSLSVVTSSQLGNGTNYGDLASYISYNNCEVIESQVYSVFDLLYQAYNTVRRSYLARHHNISAYDSENLLFTVIESLLGKPKFRGVECAVHVSLSSILRDRSLLDADEKPYALHPRTHVDFLLYRKINKSPIMAIEVDGTSFHSEGSVQYTRDQQKNRIFEKYGIPLLRLRTDESGEKEKIEQALLRCLGV